MVQCSNIRLVTTNTSLPAEEDVCLVNASGGNITLTLPNITTDGMNYQIIRIGTNTNTVTLQGFSGAQTISGNVNISISTNTAVSVQSYNSVWYITQNNVTSGYPAKSLFTSAFVQNNGSPFITFSGSNTPSSVCFFPYSGYTQVAISRVTIVVAASNGNPNGNARLRLFTGGPAIIATIPYNITSANPVTLSTTTIANLPANASVLYLDLDHTGPNNKLNMYSLTVE